MTPEQSDGNAGRAPTATLTFVVTTAAVLAFLYLIRRILLPFVLAAIVAYVCTPLIDALAARARGYRWLFALLVLLVLLALAAARRLSSGLLWMVSPRRRPIVLEFWHRLDPILRRYFIGIALVVVYASTAAYIGLGLFLGLHHALLLAAITGLFELLPLVGPVASAVLAGLVAVRQAASVSSIRARGALRAATRALRAATEVIITINVGGGAALARQWARVQ